MPTEKVLAAKKSVVAELTEKMRNAQSGILVDYKGITVEQDTKLRAELRKAGVQYQVVKNTLLGLAFKEIGLEGMESNLSGTTAIAMNTTDPLAAAKVLSDFAKKNEKFTIKAGYMDGAAIDAKTVDALSKVPSREVLIAQLCFGLNACISGLAIALDQIAKKNAE